MSGMLRVQLAILKGVSDEGILLRYKSYFNRSLLPTLIQEVLDSYTCKKGSQAPLFSFLLSFITVRCHTAFSFTLAAQVNFLQTELARMPSDSNNAIYVPQVFKLPHGIDECEVLNVYSDSD
eukprot:937415-Pelagomonas_calceolata.AAC.2